MTFSILFNELNKSEGSSLVAVSNQRLLLMVVSLAAEQTLGHSGVWSCGAPAELPRSMWDPPRLGIKPVSPTLQGAFLTSGPPGKPSTKLLKHKIF